MNRSILTLAVSILFHAFVFGQDSSMSKKRIVITETIRLINRSELFSNYKKMAGDTLNPTSLIADFNGDKKLDLAGFFTGVTQGFFIFGNVNSKENDTEQLYQFYFDSSWFDHNRKFQAVIRNALPGEKVLNAETGTLEILDQYSVRIIKENGLQFIVTYQDKSWKMFKTK